MTTQSGRQTWAQTTTDTSSNCQVSTAHISTWNQRKQRLNNIQDQKPWPASSNNYATRRYKEAMARRELPKSSDPGDLEMALAATTLSDPVPDNQSLATFPLFLRLPAELRRMVWNFAADMDAAEQRVIRMHVKLNKSYPNALEDRRAFYVEVSSTIPAVLGACFESREATLAKFEKKDILSSYTYDGSEPNGSKAYYVDLENDLFFIDCNDEIKYSHMRFFVVESFLGHQWFRKNRHTAYRRPTTWSPKLKSAYYGSQTEEIDDIELFPGGLRSLKHTSG